MLFDINLKHFLLIQDLKKLETKVQNIKNWNKSKLINKWVKNYLKVMRIPICFSQNQSHIIMKKKNQKAS